MRFWLLLIIFSLSLFPTFAQDEYCTPVLSAIRFDGERDIAVSRRILELFQADQAARQSPAIDWETLIPEDRARREEVLGYLQAGQVVIGEDLFRVAMIFQHGDCPAHYALAADLALRAFNDDYFPAGWLYAAATDRYLQNIGELQQYGTQYVQALDGHLVLCPVSGAITDEERAVYGLPTLVALQARAQEIEADTGVQAGRFTFLVQIPVLGKILNAMSIRANCGVR